MITIMCDQTKVLFSGVRPCENAARYVLPDGTLLCGLCEMDAETRGFNISRDEGRNAAMKHVARRADLFLKAARMVLK